MLRSFEQDFRTPRYLNKVVLKFHLRDRRLLYDALDVRRERASSAGITQGLVLVPDLYNAFYDGLLRADLPKGVSLTRRADDVALNIKSREM